MSQWWTYSLSDFLLFSPRTYRRLFEIYNAQAWPLHLLALASGIGVAALLWRAHPLGWHLSRVVLAAAWGWVGYGFLMRHYTSINWAGSYVAVAFTMQAVLVAAVALGAGKRKLHAGLAKSTWWSGALLIAFGLLVQPLIGPLLGRPWSQMEVFGMAPDPTITVTLGVLALAAPARLNLLLWPIPVVSCALSGTTLWLMQDADAWVMPAVAAVAMTAAWRGRSQQRE